MSEALTCPSCGTEVAPNLLTCPGCQRLVHSERLRQLADEAGRATRPAESLAAWRSALELLPPSTKQHAAISERIATLGREVERAPRANPALSDTAPPEAGRGWAGAAGLGALALLAWKAKVVLLLVATKGKLLLLGLAKLGTLSSMMLSVGVYATQFGWKLAFGLVASIYVHEMGHVAALVRYGVKADAPMFVPGLGAFVRIRQTLGDPRQDARVGLAGPLWGCVTATVVAVIWLTQGAPTWGAIAKLGAGINLFNLLPFAPLDGGRAFGAFNRPQRWLALLGLSVCWALTVDPLAVGLLTLLMLVGVATALTGRPAATPDWGSLLTYVALAAVLTFLTGINPPLGNPLNG